MSEQKVYWHKNNDGEPVRTEDNSKEIIPEGSPIQGFTFTQYRVVGITKARIKEHSVATDSKLMAKKKKELWDKTGYYRKTWIQKRVIGEWTDDEQSNG